MPFMLTPLVAAGMLALSEPASAGSAAPVAAPAYNEASPPAPPAAMAALIGLYGAPERFVNVYEAGGDLYADGLGLSQAKLTQLGQGRYEADGRVFRFDQDALARPSGLLLDGERLARRDFGAEAEASLHAAVRANAVEARRTALAATPPQESPPARAADLVDLATVDRTIRFDIRYAGPNNFMGIPLYERAAAYLQRPAAEALGRVNRALTTSGYGLLIHDGYRPWFVTKMFWDAVPPEAQAFVADPQQGSRHNRGSAVDLTLYDLRTGRAVDMPGRYDEFSVRSYPEFIGGTARQRWLRQLLRREMEREGFTVDPYEWWHFDHRDWAQYGIGTITFTELARPAK